MSEFLCDDCMKHLLDYPNNYFDLAIVDPPYGLGEHGGRMRSGYVKQKNGTMRYVQGPYYAKKSWDKAVPGEEYFRQLFRVSRNQIIFGANYFKFPMQGGENHMGQM